MKNPANRLLLVGGLAIVSLMLASCESTDKSNSSAKNSEFKTMDSTQGTREVNVTPGIAGGTIDETTTVEAKILAVNPAERTLRLVDDNGNRADFKVGSEVKNLDQLEAGEKIVATLKERMTVYVQDGNDGTSAAYAQAIASAPKGAKPGALSAEAYQVVARVTAINKDTRMASLKFVDGKTRDVKVRSDVDLDRYHVGDSVIIRVTNALAMVTKKQIDR